MIKIEKTNEECCNVCNGINKEKYYKLWFLNRLKQGAVINLCEDCKNELLAKLHNEK